MASIDRKLHRMVLEARIRAFSSAAELARLVESKELDEFSYVREGETRYSSWQSIVQYVRFAQRIGLLTDDLMPTSPSTSDMRDFKNFKLWAGGKLLEYADRHEFGPERLRGGVLKLTGDKRLPTAFAIWDVLRPSLPPRIFRWCLQAQALLRETTLKIHRGWLWIPRGTLT